MVIKLHASALCVIVLFTAISKAEDRVITTAAGTGKTANNGVSGSATALNLPWPFGLAIGPNGGIYMTGCIHHRVWRMDPLTQQIQVVAGSGTKGWSGDGENPLKARMDQPYEVQLDEQGNMYIVEMANHLIRKVDIASQKIHTLAGDGVAGFRGDGDRAQNARFRSPHSIALDDRGYLYVADIGNHRVRRIDLRQLTIETISGTGEPGFPLDGAPAKGSPLPGPRALAVEKDSLWIVMREGHSLWRMDMNTRRLHHIAGTGVAGYSGDGFPAKEAQLNGPKGIAIGPDKDIFIVDSENDCIRRIDRETLIIDTVAGTGRSRTFSGDGGPARQSQLSQPHGIVISPAGTVYIADTLNHRVRKFKRPE